VSLDVGTDNQELLDDDLYIGWRGRRLRGEEYASLVDEFVHAVKRRFPRALLQWEDFRKGNAFALLDRYRKVLPSFNDDIEGTAAMALAGLIAGTRSLGMPLVNSRVVVVGAGAAGVGIARLLRDTLRRAGADAEAVTRSVAVLDHHGLVVEGEGPDESYRHEVAWPQAMAEAHGFAASGSADLLSVVRRLHPTALIGVSGAPGTFTEAVVREMARHVERPLILPLSNPTSQAEAKPADVLAWTSGRALVATGSPFDPVVMDGRTIRIGQGNNSFIFPGVGLGALLAEAREVTPAMFAAAAQCLADQLRQEDVDSGSLYPPIAALRRVTARIAEAVMGEASESGVGLQMSAAEIPARVAEAMWDPRYLPLVRPR